MRIHSALEKVRALELASKERVFAVSEQPGISCFCIYNPLRTVGWICYPILRFRSRFLCGGREAEVGSSSIIVFGAASKSVLTLRSTAAKERPGQGANPVWYRWRS
jgi:hypothetical protein